MPEGGPETRCGFIAVIGATNAGKSTLVNTLVGAKVAIVSRKVQTTRATLRGIAIEGTSQLVFIDTPGIFAPRRRLDRAMVEAAWGGAGDADGTADGTITDPGGIGLSPGSGLGDPSDNSAGWCLAGSPAGGLTLALLGLAVLGAFSLLRRNS